MIKHTSIKCLSLFVALFAVNTSFGHSLSADLAQRIVAGCSSHSSAKQQSHAIAVVDLSGTLVSFLRMTGNPPGVGEFAIDKAEAVASWGFSTGQMEQAVAGTPGFGNAPKIVTVAGGVPIYSEDGEFLGAVGVSGGAPADDESCAIAGVEAAGLSSTRN